MSNGSPNPQITFEAGPADSGGHRLVIVRAGDREIHRDRLNSDQVSARMRFLGHLSDALDDQVDSAELELLLIEAANTADQQLIDMQRTVAQNDSGGRGQFKHPCC